ncbi:Rho termination factor N-terminal domain-containing protein [Gordonia sp. NPDC003429]
MTSTRDEAMGNNKKIKQLQKQVGELQQGLDDVRKAAEKQVGRAVAETESLRRELLKRVGVGGSDATPAPAASKLATKTAAAKPADSAKPSGDTPGGGKQGAAKPTAAKPAAAKTTKSAAPTVRELRARAKSEGVKGYSSMTKAQLIDALNGAR